MLGDEGGWRGLYQSSKTRWICSHVKARLTLNGRRQKEMNPGRAAEGSQLEESVIWIVQRHDEAFRATYITIIRYGLK